MPIEAPGPKRPVPKVIAGNGPEIARFYESFGLDPECVRSFRLIIEPDSIVRVEAELWAEVDGIERAGTVAREYFVGLHEVPPMPVTPRPTPGEIEALRREWQSIHRSSRGQVRALFVPADVEFRDFSSRGGLLGRVRDWWNSR